MPIQIDVTKLDNRLAERFIRQGKLDEKDWDKHLKSLVDVENKAEVVTTELETGVLVSNEE